MSGGGTTNTTTSSSAPPAAYTNAFQDVFNQAQNVAQTPYSPYQGNIVAGFSPDQTAAMQQVEGITANGGIQAPYLQAAQQSITNAQTPLWPNVQQFSPQTMSQYESPYTQQVVNATENQLNNQNAIQQQGVVGNAVAQGGWGGDRSAVAQALTAGQQQANEAPTIAGLENQGYSQALQEFNQQQGTQLGANEANAWLGSQAGALESGLGATAQQAALTNANALEGVGGMQQQYAQELLNVPYEQNLAAQAYPFQTTGWLANIGEGLGSASGGTSTTTSPGPSVVSQAIGLGTAGVGAYNALNNASAANTATAAANIAANNAGFVDSGTWDAGQRGGRVGEDGIGSVPASRAPGGSVPDVSLSILPGQFGMSASPISTPSDPGSIVPGASGMGSTPASHGTPDILKNYGTTSTSTTSGGESTLGSILQGAGQIAAGIYGGPAGAAAAGALNSQVHFNHGGMVPARRDVGGSANASWENPLLEENLDNQIATMLTASGMAKGGALKRAMGGMSMSDESPWWERSAEREATDRHGLLTSSVAGRTDHLPISPAAGSYVVPADVVSGLGEGNTLAGANIMQRILDTGPHGIRMPVSAHSHMGPPRPPPVYREGMGDDGMATGGAVQHRATGGVNNAAPTFDANGQWAPIQVPTSQPATPVQTGPASPANTLGSNLPAQAPAAQGPMTSRLDPSVLAGLTGPQNPASAASSGKLAQQGMGTGINASTGKGSSNTGIPALDAYLNGIESQTVFNQPPAQAAPAPAPAAAATNTSSVASNSALSPYESAYLASITNNPAYSGAQQGIADSTGGGGMKRGGMVPRRADGGAMGEDPGPDVIDLNVDSTPGETLPVPPIPPSGGPPPPPGMDAAQAASLAPANMGKHTPDGPPAQNGKFHAEADPWLALMQAGFGMAAGKSPHALENIGAGGEAGVKSYIQQKQQANQQNLQSDIWGGKLGVAQDKNSISEQRAQSYNLINAARAQHMADGDDEKTAMDKAMMDWRNGTLDETTRHHGVTEDLGQQNATTRATSAASRSALSAESLALRKQIFDEQVKQHGIQNDAKAQAQLATQLSHLTDEQLRAQSNSRDPMGMKPMQTPEQAAGTVQKMRDNAKTMLPKSPVSSAPPVPAEGIPPVSSFFNP